MREEILRAMADAIQRYDLDNLITHTRSSKEARTQLLSILEMSANYTLPRDQDLILKALLESIDARSSKAAEFLMTIRYTVKTHNIMLITKNNDTDHAYYKAMLGQRLSASEATTMGAITDAGRLKRLAVASRLDAGMASAAGIFATHVTASMGGVTDPTQTPDVAL